MWTRLRLLHKGTSACGGLIHTVIFFPTKWTATHDWYLSARKYREIPSFCFLASTITWARTFSSYSPVAAYLNQIRGIFILTYFLLDGFCQVKAMNDVEKFSKSSVICLYTTKKISAYQTYTIFTLTDIPWDILGNGYAYPLSLSSYPDWEHVALVSPLPFWNIFPLFWETQSIKSAPPM